MKRYWFELTDARYRDLDASIPDGSDKQAAVRYAKKWMRENGVKCAMLSVNSMRTDNLLDVIDIAVETTAQSNHPQPLSSHTQNAGSEPSGQTGPAGNKTIYVRSCYLGLSPSNPRRAISTISAEEYESFCRTRIGRFYLSLNDYRPCNPQCGRE